MTAFRPSSRVGLWLLSPLVVLSACGRSNSGTLSVKTRPEVVDAASQPRATKDKDTSTCLEPGKVLAGVEYTCADGKTRKGMFLAESLQECSKDGDVGCVATSRFKAADTQIAMPGVIKSGVTLAGVAGTLTFQGPAGCAADGETGCVSTVAFPAVDKSLLTPGVLKAGVAVAGVSGAYPSAAFPLTGADGSVADLTDLSPSLAAGTYEFFDSAGVRKTGQIVDQGTVTPGLADQTISPSSGLMRSVVVKGDSNLLAVNIKGGVSLFGVTGSIAGVPATCSSDGQSNCVASASYPAANATGLASKVLSGQTVAGVVGNVTLPLAASVRDSVSYGVGGNGTSGSLGNCASEGASACVVDAATTFRAASTTGLAAKVLTGQSVAGVAGSAALRPADCAADGATNCVAVTGFVAADTTSLASKVLSGQTVAGIAGNVTLPAASAVRTSATFGPNGGTTGTLADCALDGATGCVSTVGFPAANLTYLSPGNIRKTATIGGVAGDYPSGTYPLPGASGIDLPSLDSSVSAGTYQFWKKDGTRVTGSISDAGSITVGTSDQTFSTSLYRGFTVPGDANLVGGSIRSGVSIFGVAGNVTLPATSAVRTGTSYGVGGNGSSGGLANCSSEGGSDCVVDAGTSYRAASTTGLASKVISTASAAGVTGNVVLPATTDVKLNVQYGVSGTSLTGSYAAAAVADCTTDGQSDCKIPASGTLKSADTANFNGWDIRKKRNQATGAVLTFAGLAGQSKTCRNRARTALYDNTTAPAAAGLDFFDTIDDYNNNLTGLPGEIPAWTVINSANYGADYACGGIYATGSTATGNTGADSSLAHDADGNWQDLTPGTLPGGGNSTNTANGCNASDKHCVFKELISGLMVTEVSAATYTWVNAISYCETLGESGHPVVALRSPIPVIGGQAYSDWRLPTQKELMQIYQGGVRGLNQTSNLTTFFGDVDTWFWSSSSVSNDTSSAWFVGLNYGLTVGNAKTDAFRVVCVR